MLCLILFMLMCGCSRNEYSACVNQPFENVFSIELLDTHDNKNEVMYVLTDAEFEGFWSEFMTIKFHRFFNDPPTEYGILAVKITYLDGYYDIIGPDVNWYFNPSGKGAKTKVYYALNEDDFVYLFLKYVGEAQLPEELK